MISVVIIVVILVILMIIDIIVLHKYLLMTRHLAWSANIMIIYLKTTRTNLLCTSPLNIIIII